MMIGPANLPNSGVTSYGTPGTKPGTTSYVPFKVSPPASIITPKASSPPVNTFGDATSSSTPTGTGLSSLPSSAGAFLQNAGTQIESLSVGTWIVLGVVVIIILVIAMS